MPLWSAEQRRALQLCSSRRAGDVLPPLFTLQLITILLNALQTARRQPSHVCLLRCVCVWETGKGGCRVWDKERERETVMGLHVCTLRRLHMYTREFEEGSRFQAHLHVCYCDHPGMVYWARLTIVINRDKNVHMNGRIQLLCSGVYFVAEWEVEWVANRSFSQQMFWLVVAEKEQVFLITLR